MAEEVKKPPILAKSWKQWAIGIPISLVVLLLFILFVQPWGPPRESITSTAPRDGDFYDPSVDQNPQDASQSTVIPETTNGEDTESHNSASRIVDVNLASWKPIDEDEVAKEDLPKISDEVEARVLVEISSDLWTKNVGDSVQLAIPQREEVLIGRVTTIDVDNPSFRVLKGLLKDGPNDYVFVLTLGPASTTANITTATGNYELVGTSDYGWLMASSDVEYNLPDHLLVDPDSRDRVLEPDTPRAEEE